MVGTNKIELTNLDSGLSQNEALRRPANKEKKSFSNLSLAMEVFWRQCSSLFFVLLVISAGASFFLGENNDGMIISFITFANLLMGFFQDFRASKSSEKLLRLVHTFLYVLREGKLIKLRSDELVLGDIVHLSSGDIVPVDLLVRSAENLFIDESVRTGETLPKEVVAEQNVLGGSTIASGKLIGQIVALGDASSLSKYREKLESLKKVSSFNVFTDKVVKYVFVVAASGLLLSMLLLVFILGKYSLVQFFIFSIALLVGVVPEALPLIVTMILTRESIILAKKKVIVKRLSSLEELGVARFLLVDKTGTITENKLKVSAIRDSGGFWNSANAIIEGRYERSGMDEAFDSALLLSIGRINSLPRTISDFEPFSREKGYAVFTLVSGEKIARGPTKNILNLCSIKDISLEKSAEEFEAKGMRVIALAEEKNDSWGFSGFAAFEDPIKKNAKETIKRAHDIGVRVKILTGDSVLVAHSVAEELGIIRSKENIISLDEIHVAEISDEMLKQAVVFARCLPEDKLELINRYIKIAPVAFLGDGINDALALKRSDIGIAVDNASDIAKQSGDVILLEKDLNPILEGIMMGRKAFRNILIYIIYTLSGNAGTFFSLLVVSFFFKDIPMLSIQILLNNLLTDLPLMLIATDNADEYSLKHTPHYELKSILKRVVIFGVISSAFDFIYFALFNGLSLESFRTGWFILSVLTELALVLSIRSSRPLFKSPALSMPLAIGMLVASVLPFVFVYGPGLSEMFSFSTLSFAVILKLVAIVVIYMFINEAAKYLMRKKNLYNKPVVIAGVLK